MAENLIEVLTRFHREVLKPDIHRIVDDAIGGAESRLRDEMQRHFDALSQRLGRLEQEYHMLVAGLKRVEERLDGVEQRLDRIALRSELIELKVRVEGLQAQVQVLEGRLAE